MIRAPRENYPARLSSSAVDAVPAVTSEMLVRVERDLHDVGAIAMFIGPLTGTPYKLYAVPAPAAGIDLCWFLLISVPAGLILTREPARLSSRPHTSPPGHPHEPS